MSTLEPVVVRVDGVDVVRAYRFKCLGCGRDHFVSVNGKDPNGREWTIAGPDGTRTVAPDVANKIIDAQGFASGSCLLAIVSGAAVFRSGSTHPLKGQTVAMVEALALAVAVEATLTKEA